MNDTTLVTGVLSRLDALTSKMGVAASEVWSIWLATSWRPAFAAFYGIGICLVALVLGGWTAKRGIDKDLEPLFFVGALPFAIAAVSLVFNLASLPDALVYLSEPRLYALDQLRELVGK